MQTLTLGQPEINAFTRSENPLTSGILQICDFVDLADRPALDLVD